MLTRIVCVCNQVDEKEIRSIQKKGATSTADIQRLTRAGTSCGRCLPVIDQLVFDFEKKRPKGQQQKLDFGS